MPERTPRPPRRRLTRRQFLAGGVAVGGAVATGAGLVEAWRQLGREDLIPGDPVDVALRPDRWTTTADQVSFAALGDNGSGGRKAMAVAEEMARSYREEPFGSVSLLGDICYYGPIDERFEDVFVQPLRPLIDADVAFELAIGNHDGDLWFEEGVPDVEATLELLGTPGRYYSVSRGPADFFYLDSGRLLPPERDDAQLRWFERALRASDAPWRIVCLHHPLYSSGVHGSHEDLRPALEPLVVEHGVQLVLAGHDHHYERSVPVDGVTHVVSGGGCKLTPVRPREHAAFAASTLQFLRIDIDGDQLRGRAIELGGSSIDRFEITAAGAS